MREYPVISLPGEANSHVSMLNISEIMGQITRPKGQDNINDFIPGKPQISFAYLLRSPLTLLLEPAKESCKRTSISENTVEREISR